MSFSSRNPSHILSPPSPRPEPCNACSMVNIWQQPESQNQHVLLLVLSTHPLFGDEPKWHIRNFHRLMQKSCTGVDTFWQIGCGTILQSDHSILCQWETLRSGAIFGITPLTQQARILPFCSGRSNMDLYKSFKNILCALLRQEDGCFKFS